MATNAASNFQAPVNILQLFGYPNLMGYANQSEMGIPDPFAAIWGKEFYTAQAETDKVIGDYGIVTMVTGNKQTAKRQNYGGPSIQLTLRQLGQMPFKFIHAINHIDLPLLTYAQLMDYTKPAVQRMAEGELYRQVDNFKVYFQNLRIAGSISALAYGTVNFDELGNLLAPTAAVPNGGTAVVIPIPNGTNGTANPDTNVVGVNMGTVGSSSGLDPLSSGTLIFGAATGSPTAAPVASAGTWANAATRINQQITNLKKAAAQLAGFNELEPKVVFYGQNVPDYVMNNSWMAEYIKRNPGMNQKWMDTGEIPDGVFGMRWVPAYKSFFRDQTQTNQQLWGNNRVLITPEFKANGPLAWFGGMEGSYIVAEDTGEVSSGGPPKTGKTVYGMAFFGQAQLVPPVARVYGVDTWFPGVKNPLAVFACDVA